jgi:glc operon protein GlcG
MSAMASIDAQVAAELIQDAVARAAADGTAVSVAVCDETGCLVAFRRMSGAPRFSADFAIAKARTSATFATPTSALEELYQDRPAFAHSFVAQGDYFLGRGGVPLYPAVTTSSDGVLGAIGVSGATAHGEEALALAVVDASAGLSSTPS